MKTIIAVLMLAVTIPVGQAFFTPMVGQGLEAVSYTHLAKPSLGARADALDGVGLPTP